MFSPKDILNFHFNVSQFSAHIRGFNSSKFESDFEKQLDELKIINEKMGEASYHFGDELLAQRALRKFIILTQSNEKSIQLDKREIKALAFSLDYCFNDDASIVSSNDILSKAIEIFEANWKYGYLLGMVLCYLKNWGRSEFKGLDKLRQYIANKIEDYDGTRSTIVSLKNNHRYFFNRNGSIILGSDFAMKELAPKKVCEYLGLPSSWVSYSYFSDFILAYLEKKKSSLPDIILEIEKFLLIHDNPITTLKVISRVIVQVENMNLSEIQERVQNFAIKNIGDPVKSRVWEESSGLKSEEVNEIQKAKTILNKWITKRFINVFFETCLNDRRRRAFWLTYSDKVETFRVFGPLTTKQELQLDNRVSEFVSSRYQVTYGNSGISAIVMVINNYKLIEFSDPGYAFYAYRKNSLYAPDLEETRYSSVNNFRNGHLPYLAHRTGFQFTGFSPEGRLSHNDGDLIWEQVFKTWIEKYV